MRNKGNIVSCSAVELKKMVESGEDQSDVLDWFKRQGRGYQTRINAALRAFVEAHERK